MTEEKAKIIFEQYNRTSDVVRCPNGRAIIRKVIDSYARAAVNLYGIISRDDFVSIFNKQNADWTSNEEIYILLLPLVLKDGWYCFYKEYIVHYWLFNDFDQADYLLKYQADKPRYIPKKVNFLNTLMRISKITTTGGMYDVLCLTFLATEKIPRKAMRKLGVI